ncbi:Peroxisomal multifunctional enzyme type 2 [Habropoda laboriosa]|uniref:Peroxisomal multifunctional enzyme type 2 n=1 Tax=Habropoda laboriosa TaxID=597456 RepID=A0A0L7QZX3_9HYME|nr:PREDICTED: peroxisomal multifunctional enzyme type 2 [Habropoda laboriosa]KOC64143.1 Peroxisomal multifunctional enzyme type 2 [Habropoda laboriosa]
MRGPEELRFDGRVVIVTGAGAGLGRAYALLFGSRGASVVVNDLGGGRHGDGSSTKSADAVVNEIKKNGGKAVANYDSVLDGAKIVKTAIDTFGRVDVVVNNAGILRDRSFAKLSETDWDMVQNVHLKGAFKTTQAAWPYFVKQNYGRVIMTASNSGMYGNFGQSNYGAAKMGLIGLTNTLAIEGRNKNIYTNVIIPTAASRLTEDILPPELFQQFKPELIAPVVIWMCHEKCTENGSIIESALGWAGKSYVVCSSGSTLRQNFSSEITPEDVAKRWSAITDMSSVKHFTSIEEKTAQFVVALEEMKSGKSASQNSEVLRQTYSSQDTILYALGVGASVQTPSDIRYLYENDSNFAVLPTFYTLHGPAHCLTSSMYTDNLPNFEIDPTKMLHGEQYIEVYKQLPTEGTVETRFILLDILDKEKGAVFVVQHETFDSATGDKLSTGQMTIFIIGAGGFQGKKTSSNLIPIIDPPKRQPDASVTQQTSYDQAALYRLNGDRNPLHIDSSMATMSGFKRPILHGLCSLGFSVRHVLQTYADGDPNLFKAVKTRFAKPVLPGETLRTDMWQEGNRIHFQTYTIENNTPVLTGGYVDLKNTISKQPRANPRSGNENLESLESDAVFNTIEQYVKANPAEVKKINAVFLYHILVKGKPQATWTLDLKKPEVYRGELKSGKADATLTLEDADMIQMALGKLNPQVAFMRGKLKITGNIMLTQKLKVLMEAGKSKL